MSVGCLNYSLVQALMGGGMFCYIMQTLKAAHPQLPEKQYPLLHAFADLAQHLSPQQALPNGSPSPDHNAQSGQVSKKSHFFKLAKLLIYRYH